MQEPKECIMYMIDLLHQWVINRENIPKFKSIFFFAFIIIFVVFDFDINQNVQFNLCLFDFSFCFFFHPSCFYFTNTNAHIHTQLNELRVVEWKGKQIFKKIFYEPSVYRNSFNKTNNFMWNAHWFQFSLFDNS